MTTIKSSAKTTTGTERLTYAAIDAMTVPELKAACKANSVTGYSRLNKIALQGLLYEVADRQGMAECQANIAWADEMLAQLAAIEPEAYAVMYTRYADDPSSTNIAVGERAEVERHYSECHEARIAGPLTAAQLAETRAPRVICDASVAPVTGERTPVELTPADILAATLEAAGGKRWTKYGKDRVYVDATVLGLEVEYYKTGNVSSATWRGEMISNAQARRLLGSKVFVDLATGELHVTTSYVAGYGEQELEDVARAWYDAATATDETAETEAGDEAETTAESITSAECMERGDDPTDPEPTTTEDKADKADTTTDTTTTDETATASYLTADEIAALEAAGFRRWQKFSHDRLYYDGQCFDGGIYAIYSDAEARAWVDVETGELHARTCPRDLEGHVLERVGEVYYGIIAEARRTEPTIAESIAAMVDPSTVATTGHMRVWCALDDARRLSVWEISAYGMACALSEGVEDATTDETIDRAQMLYDRIYAALTKTGDEELADEVREMRMWLDAIACIDEDGADYGDSATVCAMLAAMRGTDDDPEPDGTPQGDAETTDEGDSDESTDCEAEYRAEHPHTTTATVWVPSYGAVCAMPARSLPVGIVTVCTGGATETIVDKIVSKSGKTVTFTVRGERGTVSTRRRNADTMVAVNGHRITSTVWHIDWPTETEETTEETERTLSADSEAYVAILDRRISDAREALAEAEEEYADAETENVDAHSYPKYFNVELSDHRLEEAERMLAQARQQLADAEADKAEYLDWAASETDDESAVVGTIDRDGCSYPVTRDADGYRVDMGGATGVSDAMAYASDDEALAGIAEIIDAEADEADHEGAAGCAKAIRLTGATVDGCFIGAPRRSCKPYDEPTDERVLVTLDGKAYERTVYERRIWRNMKPHTTVARFVIIDGTFYAVASRGDAARARWTAKADEPGVYLFEDGRSWLASLGDVCELHTEVDGREVRTDLRRDDYLGEDFGVFDGACDLLDRMAAGWRPVNWQG